MSAPRVPSSMRTAPSNLPRSLHSILGYGASRMKKPLPVFALALALCAVLWLTGCAGPSGVTGGNSGGSGNTAAATATSHTPRNVKITDAASCSQFMSLDEANQIMGEKAANIRVSASNDDESDSGSCNYETLPFKATVFVAYFPGSGPTVEAASKAITGHLGFKGTVTDISGVGDKAIFIVNPIPSTSIVQYHLMIGAGTLLIDCVIPKNQPDNNTALNRLKQVAQLVISRL